MKTKFFLYFVLFTMLIGIDGWAQKVQKSRTTNEVFIDCYDLPWATTESQVMISNFKNSSVFKRLQISSKPCLSTTGMETMTWSEAMGIDESYNTKSAIGEQQRQKGTGCATYWEKSEGEKGSWRLPTQRELQLIWVLTNDGSAINSSSFLGPLSKTNITFKKDQHWSASEGGNTNAYSVTFISGYVGSYPKTNSYIVRCVRERSDR